MAQDASRRVGACKSVKERAEEHPLVGNRFGKLGGADGDNLGQDAANGADDHHALAAIAIRERPQLRRRERAQGSGEDIEGQRELGHVFLHLRDEALPVVAARYDRREGEVGVSGHLVGKVVLADEVDDSGPGQHGGVSSNTETVHTG
jgi:hypothetical protein